MASIATAIMALYYDSERLQDRDIAGDSMSLWDYLRKEESEFLQKAEERRKRKERRRPSRPTLPLVQYNSSDLEENKTVTI